MAVSEYFSNGTANLVYITTAATLSTLLYRTIDKYRKDTANLTDDLFHKVDNLCKQTESLYRELEEEDEIVLTVFNVRSPLFLHDLEEEVERLA